MSTSAIRYRFDGPGPASFLVEHGGVLRVFCRGALSAPLSGVQVKAMLTDPKRGWVPASGEVLIETVSGDRWFAAPGAMPMPLDAREVEVEVEVETA